MIYLKVLTIINLFYCNFIRNFLIFFRSLIDIFESINKLNFIYGIFLNRSDPYYISIIYLFEIKYS